MSRRLAVVIPCLNALEGLRTTWAALQPVRAHLEVAIVDGGSTDGLTEALLAGEFEADHVIIGEDQGIYDAMNRGWARTSAPLVWFLGAGDVPDLAGLRTLWSDGIDPDHLHIFRVELLPPREAGVPDHYPARWDGSLVWRHTTHHQGVVYPRHRLPQPPFDPKFSVLADYGLHLELFLSGMQATLHGDRLCAVQPGGASRTFQAQLYWEEWRMKKQRLRGVSRWLQPVWLVGKYGFKRLRLR